MNLKILIHVSLYHLLAAVRGVFGGPAAEGVPVARETADPDVVGALRPLLGLPAAAATHLHRRLRVHAEGARGEQRGDVSGTEQIRVSLSFIMINIQLSLHFIC